MSASKRQLVVTVGTSLFESASWDPDKLIGDLAVPGYEAWCRGEALERLEARKATAGFNRVSKALYQNLRIVEVAARLAEAFAPGFDRQGRYSAELATIIAVRSLYFTRSLGLSFAEFMTDAFSSILLVHGDAPDDHGRVAAAHLDAVLRLHGVTVAHKELSSHLIENIRQLSQFLKGLGPGVDLVASGGYKAQAIACAQEVQRRQPIDDWHLYYLHESTTLVSQFRSEDGTSKIAVANGAGRIDVAGL